MTDIVCAVPVAPIRSAPSHKSEITTELIFGETATLLEEDQGWKKIRCAYDQYEGWCHASQIIRSANVHLQPKKTFTADWINTVNVNGVDMHVPLGSSLETFSSNTAIWNSLQVTYNGSVFEAENFSPAALRNIAFKYLNTAYLWGGKSVFGIDCSGFSQSVFRFFNMPLPRDAWQQALDGAVVGFLQEASCGDLAFFDNDEGRIVHVGILLNDHEIIHSSGKVRVDKIDSMGIINTDTGERSHKLRIIKRYF
jgi:gamma-D-glutamyl-L-lysine dipeptidyl-peptidase